MYNGESWIRDLEGDLKDKVEGLTVVLKEVGRERNLNNNFKLKDGDIEGR